ncbi:hypothetical protein HERIO_1320 [Hepatospora eriocheir]|uniref:Uncharacterized protein n=1 Tax=Hepatospora eriocheir TaxID=1081669 RepID=A0A1X0QAJ9_9MICR|nr:hypothetical protein HERIO_1320 [Hepatospora eriocheir]
MIFYNKPGIIFTLREKNIKCSLNDKFNMIVHSNLTCVIDDLVHDIGFVIPIDYLSFIKSINVTNNLETDLKRLFIFKDKDDCSRLKEYVCSHKRGVLVKHKFFN